MMTTKAIIPPDLAKSESTLYPEHGWKISDVIFEAESRYYEACRLMFCGQSALYRSDKVTPKKTGLFVSLWKRAFGIGDIMPFDKNDGIEFVIISARVGENLVQFIFPQSALIKHGIFSNYGADGKRCFGVYTPWDAINNLQAKKTQAWQAQYFYKVTCAQT